MSVLINKHFNDKIRTCHLNSKQYPGLKKLLENPKEVRIAKFGVLTRYPDEAVGVSIHYMKKMDSKWYGTWLVENSNAMTMEAWINKHRKSKSFKSVEEVIDKAQN